MHEVLFSWQPQHPSHLPPCCGCDFTVAFSSPAYVSHRGCFHFYSKKKMIPGASATARTQRPPPDPQSCATSGALGGCAGSLLPAMALIDVTQRATSSLGWARAGSPGESELLSESPNCPSQTQAAPLCPVGRLCDYNAGVLSEGRKTCALGYRGINPGNSESQHSSLCSLSVVACP